MCRRPGEHRKRLVASIFLVGKKNPRKKAIHITKQYKTEDALECLYNTVQKTNRSYVLLVFFISCRYSKHVLLRNKRFNVKILKLRRASNKKI